MAKKLFITAALVAFAGLLVVGLTFMAIDVLFRMETLDIGMLGAKMLTAALTVVLLTITLLGAVIALQEIWK